MMAPKSEKFIIDFSNYIVERTDHFIGREWVFQAINDWLTDLNGSRFFLLTGEPGSGKTAIASRLVQFSYESVTPLESFVGLFPNFLSAIHFCSARDSRWINPHVFAESLAMQLMERYPDYAQALPEKSENRQIHINVQQQFGQGQATGVIINRLDTSGITPEDTFNHLIRGPLEALCRRKRNRQIIILIDALDEALVYSGNTNILSLLAHINELPPNVRFILTSRTDIRVRSAFLEAEEFSLSATEHNEYNQRDIYLYVQDQLKSDKNLVSEEPAYIAELTEVCLNKSEGNFLYIRFLLNAMSKGLRPMEDLAGLPEGLDGLYFDSLERVVKLGGRDWFNEYRSLMGVLSVTQEGLTLAQLQAFTKQSKSSVLEYRRNLQQFIEGFKVPCEKEEPEMRYRLYHQSVTEFLHQEFLTVKKSKVENSFYLPADEWHRTMADICDNDNLSIIWEDIKHKSVEQGRREYARRHFVTHLYLAREFPRLFNLLDAGEYGRAKVQHDPSTYSYAQDLVLGQQAAMWEGYSVEEGIALLPQLWRYTLLLRSLTSIAENYSLATIELLVLLNREAKAFSLIELLPKQDDKAYAMLHIARLLGIKLKEKRRVYGSF